MSESIADVLAAAGVEVCTVADLTRRIKYRLEQAFPSVWVAGEISNAHRPASGHLYFTLKDEDAQLNAVMWRGQAAALRFRLEDGMAVLMQGEITVYAPRGQYQMVCRQIHPRGVGALELAFRQLKEKLAGEGLFDPALKKPLPFLPRRVGIVTSRTGAAVRDMLRVLHERFPSIPVLIAPTKVQGEGAAEQIADAIAAMNERDDVDVLIVGRGGGSLEDLWAFNEEVVARAIHASRIPVISGVGHEIDFTISDFVADVRALTPTDAAARAVPDCAQLTNRLDGITRQLVQGLRGTLRSAREWLRAACDQYAYRQPFAMVRREEQRLDTLGERLGLAGRRLLPERRRRLDALVARLDALSPRGILGRGYSITMSANNGRILTCADQVAPGDALRTLLHEGELASRVTATDRKDDHAEKGP